MEERVSIVKLLGLPESFAVVLLIFSFILALAPYFSGQDFGLFKIPQVTDNARKKLRIIGPIVLLALVSLFVPVIPRHGAANSNNANRSDNDNTNARIEKATTPSPLVGDANSNVITVLVANFQGPDPQNYLVADKVMQRLQAATSGYSDISIQPLAEIITEQTGSEGGSAYARELGTKRNASIVLWGYYGVTSEKVDVSVHFEVLRKPEDLFLRQNLKTQTLPISDLNDFKIQTRLSGEMTYLVLLTVGLARYEARDYDAAIDRFTKALAQSNAPDEIVDPADIYFYRGMSHSRGGGAHGIDRAIADFTEAIKAIKLKPQLAVAYFTRGHAYNEKGQHDRAISDFTEAIKLEPDLALAYYNRGIAYENQGQLDRAMADYNEAIKIKPDYADAYYNRGVIYKGKGEHGRAISDFTEAIKLEPDYTDAYLNRGSAYDDKGEHDRAIADYNEAVKYKPDYAEAYTNRGIAYAEQGQLDRAMADYNEAIRLKPDRVRAYYNRAVVYQGEGEIERAIADLKIVLRKTNDPEMRQRAEQMLRELGVK